MPANDANGNPLQLDLGSIPPSVDVLSLTTTEIESQDEPSEPTESLPCRPLMIYTRPQILHLQSSPLVKSPPDMPELKHWFGEHEPSLGKKDSEPTTPNSTRDRRFRRDAEDGETSTRPSFRSTLSQPSQMGNFKHQSLRDRDRDRDGDKDRERDIRDKEGQERLRNLSDKYDRDRLAAPSALRKERDIAPHLAADSTIRGSASLSTPGRRTEGRDGAKKKVGEVSEDWRRGGDARRQDRYENSRGNREDRERPRSRGRDSSRPRRDVSSSRRDRDRDTEDRELGGDRRDDHRKQPRDDNRRTRDDHRRERDEHRRERDRDPAERDQDEGEDPRRWRDDGKRDERMAARRHASDQRVSQENGDSSDRRWTVVEERDGRSKRNHRDRRTGATADDGKDREDRRDREREKEKEKEPAWMDTYIPDSSEILGGKGGEGGMDGIQVWKKGLKEQKEKTATKPMKDEEQAAVPELTAEKQMDEIQLFKMLMKREEEKKQVDASVSENTVALMDTAPPPPGIRVQQKVSKDHSESSVADSHNNAPPPANVSPAADVPPTASNDPRSLLSILGKGEPIIRAPPLANSSPALDLSADKMQPPTSSRFFPNPINAQNAASNAEKVTTDPPLVPPSAQFNPPQGSRLLAFGSRPAPKSAGLSQPPNGSNSHPQDASSQHTAFPSSGVLQSDLSINHAPTKSESLRTGFSPFEDQSRMSFGLEEPRDHGKAFLGTPEPMRRGGDRPAYNMGLEAGSYSDPIFDPSVAGYAAGKGSRLAKFFDSKGRDTSMIQNPVAFTSSSPISGQRHEGGYNPMDHRAMDGLLSKLNNSAQVQRPNLVSPNSAPSSGGISFGQQAQNNLQMLQQQQQQPSHLHLHPNNRLDSLYESRLDDRNFMPDGMVPGLRSAPPPRSRDSAVIYSDSIDDAIHFNQPRLPPQHHRGLDQMYGPVPSVYPQQGGRNAGITMQPQYRGGPSPISNPQQQRLPPGLANLGGRPPLDGSQFIGMPGLPSPGLHTGLHPNGPPQQQQFNNNFAVNGNLNYAAGMQPQMRVPGSTTHPLQGGVQHHQLASLGHPNLDLRGPNHNQAQLLGLGGGGMRGIGIGGFGPQGPAQMQQPLHVMRQQQEQQQRQQQQQQLHQQQLPPHMMPHHLQVGHPHQQQGPNNQTDLMALLMGGTAHRE